MTTPDTVSEYNIGQEVEIFSDIKTVLDADSDPSTVTCTVHEPDETDTVYTYGVDTNLTKLSTGNYKLTLTPDSSGFWYYRWASSGGVTSEEEFKFYVKARWSA